MTIPAYIVDTLADLRARRDYLGKAIDVLSQIWEGEDQPAAKIVETAPRPRPALKTRKPERRTRRRPGKPGRRVADTSASDTDAEARRQTLLGFIQKAEVGLTIGELRALTPKMAGPERSNSLATLKNKGVIRRAGNAWVAA